MYDKEATSNNNLRFFGWGGMEGGVGKKLAQQEKEYVEDAITSYQDLCPLVLGHHHYH